MGCVITQEKGAQRKLGLQSSHLKLPSLVVLGSGSHFFFISLEVGGASRVNKKSSLKTLSLLLKDS